MSFIDISTNNQSRELRSSATFPDNYVFFPGTTITGPYDRVLTFTSVDDFKNVCGTSSPEGSRTVEIATGLLNAGLPILFRRIACIGQDTPAETLGVTKAETILTHFDSDLSADVEDIKIMEKYGGTFGNNITITIRNTGVAYWIDVYLKYTLLERKKLISISSADSQLQINEKLIKALATTEFDRIEIEVIQTDPTKFTLETVTGKALSGGTDFNEDLVKAEIPKTFEFLQDKILYQPKFLMSGGYTDDDLSTNADIANAMLNLSLKRQDCRAIIDLPIATAPENYQSLAQYIAYQQLSDEQPIPSGMILGPWQYMQVGNTQEWMPPSYAYLLVMGSALSKGGRAYTPKAGISTGQVPNVIKAEFEIGSDLSEKWQSDTEVNINPIMRLQGSRYVIAGNSTLLMPETDYGENNAFSESSADLTIIDIRRFVYNLAVELQYQYNSETAFETFALRASEYLDRMISEGAVYDYNIYNISSNADPRTLNIRLDVWLSPTIKNIKIHLNVAYGNVEMSNGGEV